MPKMQIAINNVGIIKKSTIDVDGLTVIAGANNSGKSSVGKTVYALIRAVESYEVRAAIDRCAYAVRHLREISSLFPFSIRNAIKVMTKAAPETDPIKAVFGDSELLKKVEYPEIDEFLNRFQEGIIWGLIEDSKYTEKEFESDKAKALTSFAKIIDQINDDPDLKKYVKESIRTQLNVEFANQIAPAKSPDSLVEIDMVSDGRGCFHVKLKEGDYPKNIENIFEWNPYSSVFYIDDPFVVEDDWHLPERGSQSEFKTSFLDSRIVLQHREYLKLKLSVSREENMWAKVQTNEKFKQIIECLNSVLPGSFVSENNSEFYKGVDGAKLNISNLATGSKMFSILKKLIAGGLVSERTLLILDEPECHLHPEWQNRFAEIVVLLVKKVGCHILLTTHSQNFLLALDAYTRKYQLTEKTNFYQAKSGNDGTVFENVNSKLNVIYADFLQAFSRMKKFYDELVYEDSLNKDGIV